MTDTAPDMPECEVLLHPPYIVIQSERFRKIERECAYKGFSRLLEEKLKMKVARISPEVWLEENGISLHFESDQEFGDFGE
ncbi:MAG TPA: hypothetical protein VE134_05045 [Methanomicrobiales archaeon]|nr:hypothetical protein [Methanomicrobiales archaeon]